MVQTTMTASRCATLLHSHASTSRQTRRHRTPPQPSRVTCAVIWRCVLACLMWLALGQQAMAQNAVRWWSVTPSTTGGIVASGGTLPVTVSYSADSAIPGDTVTHVELRDGATVLSPQRNYMAVPTSVGADTMVNTRRDGSITVNLGMGQHKLTLHAVTSEFWWGDSIEMTVNVTANLPPAVSLTNPANGSNYVVSSGANASVPVSGSASDSDGSVTQIELLVNGVPKASAAGTSINQSVSLPAGTHVVTLRATDNLGGVGTSAAATVTVVNNTVPAVSISSPANGSSIVVPTLPASVQVTGSATDADTGVKRVEVYLDGAAAPASTVPFGTVNQTFLLAAGSHTIRLRAIDNLDAYTDASVAVTVSQAPNVLPAVSLTAPATDAVYWVAAGGTANINVKGTATDADGSIVSTEVWIDGAQRTVIQGGTVNATFGLTPGSHSIQLKTRDNRDGTAASPSIGVSVNATARPAATFSAPINGAMYTLQSGSTLDVTVAGSASDDGSVAKIELLVNGVVNSTMAGANISKSVPLVAGTHRLRLRAYDNVGITGDSTEFVVTVDPPVALQPVPITPPHLGNADAGSLPGTLAVGNDGAATYSIPIAVPPGTGGMAPVLSLNYTSLGGNGIVGMGWSLGGLSTIHRCAKTIAQDGQPGRISFTQADRLCLDGQRLLRADGANPGTDVAAQDAAYWTAAAQYRTEQESFSRITRLANGGFKVEAKDGRIHYYGTDASSFIKAQGRADGQALLWALARTEDRVGNYVSYEYTQDIATGEYLPMQVRYGGSTTASPAQAQDLAVRFTYESRSDAQIRYAGGARNDLRNRLTHVRTYLGTTADGISGTLARDYTLHYVQSASSGRSLIDWIQVCAVNPQTAQMDCLPKTTFETGSAPLAWKELPAYSSPYQNFGISAFSQPVHGDFDGDGLDDVMFPAIAAVCPDPSCIPIPTDSGHGNENAPSYYLTNSLRILTRAGADVSTQLVFLEGTFPSTAKALLAGDLDGDGLDDLALSGLGASVFCLNKGSLRFECRPAPSGTVGPLMADFRNDRRKHFLYISTSSGSDCSLNAAKTALTCNPMQVVDTTPPSSGFSHYFVIGNYKFQSIDFSKQGLSDFYGAYSTGAGSGTAGENLIATCFSEGIEAKPVLGCKTIYQGNPKSNTLSGIRNVGDLNGDGLTDFAISEYISLNTRKFLVCLSTETGVDCQPVATGSGLYSTDTFIASTYIADVSGSGQAVLVTPGIGSTSVCRLNGQRQLDCQTVPGPTSDSTLYFEALSDHSGTGVPEAIYQNKANPWTSSSTEVKFATARRFTLAAPSVGDRITAVVNGLGQREEVDYARADDAAVYRRVPVINGVEQPPVYPLVARIPGAMVKQLRRSNGQGGWLSTDYHYEGAVADALGRANACFALIRTKDLQSGVQTTTTFALSFPYTGMAKTTVVSNPTSVVLSSTTATLDQQFIAQANGTKTVFPFTQQTVQTRRDWDASDLGTVSTLNAYGDGWGNLTKQTVTTSGGGKSFVTDTSSTFRNDASRWLVGLPVAVLVGKSDPVTGTQLRTTLMDYNPITGLQTNETIEPTQPALQVVTTFDRSGNPFGLVNKKTQSWKDPSSQITKSRLLSDTSYDAKGRFVKTVKNALGQLQTLGFDAATGAKTSHQDINNQLTTWTVDGFGRTTKETRADGNETRYYNKRCQGDCPANAVVATLEDQWHGASRMAVPRVAYANSLGNVVRTMTWGFGGRAVVADTRYDARARLYEQDAPRFDGDPAYLAQRLGYDALDRVTGTTTRDEAGVERSTSTIYQGWLTTITNARQQIRAETRNPLGQLVQVKDPKGGITQYQYEPFGALTRITDPNGNVSAVTYDIRGRRTDLKDPDLGWIHYDVDPLGQTWKQISPKQRAAGTSTRFEFDVLGRTTARYESDLQSHWVFDTAAGGIGQLAEAYTGTPTLKDYRRLHTYDALGRPSTTTQVLTDASYLAKADYDAWGRVSRQTWQRGSDAAKAYTHVYNAYGQLARIDRAGLVLWQAVSQDAAGRTTQALLGNGLKDNASFNAHTGRLQSATLQTAANATSFQEGYQYDALGNVTQRLQYWNASGFQEALAYDELNRLTTSQVAGQALQSFSYDAGGNLISKTGVGSYTYPAQGAAAMRPHAVQSIAGLGSFTYDANGNLSTAPGRSTSWTSFDMPVDIAKGAVKSTFVYGPEHQRAKQTRSDGTVILYAGAQEVETKAGQVTVKTYWPNGIGVEIDRPAKATELSWIHQDRLGSPIAITDATGNFREKLAYDAWGKRRTTDGSATPDTLDGVTDNRGFTGHEMLDTLDLVHMNGRVSAPCWVYYSHPGASRPPRHFT